MSIKNKHLQELLQEMRFGEFKKKFIGEMVRLRKLPTAISKNLTPGKFYKSIGRYDQGFIVNDDSGKETKLFYKWFYH